MELRHFDFAPTYLMAKKKSLVAREYRGRVYGTESYSSSFYGYCGCLVGEVEEVASGEVLQPCVNLSAWAPEAPL